MSRLARNNADWYHLLDMASVVGTLIADIEGIYDPRSYNDRLLLGLKGTMSEAELHTMRQRLTAGRLSKVQRGEYIQHLPTGLVRLEDGRVELDPDDQIRRVIALVFTTFAERGSGMKTLGYFKQHQILLPRRQTSGLLKGEVLERTHRVDHYRDPAQPCLCRSLRLWPSPHRSNATQTGAAWHWTCAQTHAGLDDHKAGSLSGVHHLGTVPAKSGTFGRKYAGRASMARVPAGEARSTTRGRGPSARVDVLQHLRISHACGLQVSTPVLL